MDRRVFMTGGAALVVGLPAVGLPAVGWSRGPQAQRGRGADAHGRVLQLDWPGMTRDRDTVDAAAARDALDALLMAYTGEPDPVAALRHFVQPDDVVGLKVNALAAPGHPFHPHFAWRLAEHLRALGIAPRDIIIYDQYGDRMRRSGYPAVDKPDEVQVTFHRRFGYLPRKVGVADAPPVRWSGVLGKVTAVLNLCVPKDHDLCGITGALKNMAFGNIERVPGFHGMIHEAIPWLYAQPEIRDRTRLCLCDASRVIYEGGPQDKPATRVARDALLLSEDPVAMDWAVLGLINEQRLKRGLPRIEAREKARRRPDYLRVAYGFGLGARLEDLRWRVRDRDGAELPAPAGLIDSAWASSPLPSSAKSPRGRPAPGR